MKFSTVAAISIITASTAVSGNEVTNLRKLKTTTTESGNKFRKLGGFVDHSVCELVCDDDNSTDEIQKKHCEEEKLFGCICQGKACQACPKYEICAKCDGGAGIAFNFAIGEAGISAGLVLASDDYTFDWSSVDSGNSFCATAFLVVAGESGVKYETKCASDDGSFELEVKFVYP